MPKDTFFALHTLLRAEGLLADTRNVAVEEQLAIFMAVTGKRSTNGSVQETFQHSGVATGLVSSLRHGEEKKAGLQCVYY